MCGEHRDGQTASAPPLLCPPGTKEMGGTAPKRFWKTAETPQGLPPTPPLLEARIRRWEIPVALAGINLSVTNEVTGDFQGYFTSEPMNFP